MQSTARFVALTALSDNVQFLTNCLSENGMSESFESQAETAARVAEISAFTVMQQSRRMLQRPLSIAGVEIAEANRFFVNLGSQAETCARPLMISDTIFKIDRELTTESHLIPISTQYQSREEDQMPTVVTESIRTPHAWDFRAKEHGLTDRSWDWPALDEESLRLPPENASVVWSKTPGRTRIPSLARKKAAAADAECLRELLNTAMTREIQRFGVRAAAPNAKTAKRESLVGMFFASVLAATRSLTTKFAA